MQVTEIHRDTLREIVSIGVGRAAASLNSMVGHKVLIQIPTLEILSQAALDTKLSRKYGHDISVVRMKFDGDVSGDAAIIFPPDSSSALVRILTGSMNIDEVGALREGTLMEVGNIIINSVIGSISNMLGFTFKFDLPYFSEGVAKKLMKNAENKDDMILVANAELSVDELEIEGSIIVFFSMGSLVELLQKVDTGLLT